MLAEPQAQLPPRAAGSTPADAPDAPPPHAAAPTAASPPSFVTSIKDRVRWRPGAFGSGGNPDSAAAASEGTPLAAQAATRKDDVWSLLSLRCRAWKQLVKTLLVYFHHVADVQAAAARGYAKAATVLVMPQNFGGGQFIEPATPTEARDQAAVSGVQAVLQVLHQTTKMFATADSNSCNNLGDTTVNTLERLQKQINARAEELSIDSRARATDVERARELTMKKQGELSKAIEAYGRSSGVNTPDPWLANHAVRVMLNNQLIVEREYKAAAAAALESFAEFETRTVVPEIRMTLSSFMSNYGSPTTTSNQDVHAAVNAMQDSIEKLAVDTEWQAFVERNDAYVSPVREMVPSLTDVEYEHRDDEICRIVYQGPLERKRFGWWKQEVWVLTAGGWMHSFPNNDLLAHSTPDKSICVVGSQLHTLGDSNIREILLSEKGKGGAFLLADHRYRLRPANDDDGASNWVKALGQFARAVNGKNSQLSTNAEAHENIEEERDKNAAAPSLPMIGDVEHPGQAAEAVVDGKAAGKPEETPAEPVQKVANPQDVTTHGAQAANPSAAVNSLSSGTEGMAVDMVTKPTVDSQTSVLPALASHDAIKLVTPKANSSTDDNAETKPAPYHVASDTTQPAA